MRFKEFLLEAKSDRAPWMTITDPVELMNDVIRRDLKRYVWDDESLDSPRGQEKIADKRYGDEFKSWSFNKNGTVTFRASEQRLHSGFCIHEPQGDVLPFMIQSAKDLQIRCEKLISAWGFPEKAKRVELTCERLKTLDHMNSVLDNLVLKTPSLETFGDCEIKARGLHIGQIGMESLSGIHKHFTLTEYIGFSTFNDDNPNIITSHMLGIMAIKGGIHTCSISYGYRKHDETPFTKTCDIIDKHLKGDKDMLDCQEELVQAGLKEYAKL